MHYRLLITKARVSILSTISFHVSDVLTLVSAECAGLFDAVLRSSPGFVYTVSAPNLVRHIACLRGILLDCMCLRASLLSSSRVALVEIQGQIKATFQLAQGDRL